MPEDQLAEAVHFLMSEPDPDVQALTRNVCEGLGVDLVEWAKEAPDEVLALAEAARDMVAQAPPDQLQSFTSFERYR